LLSTLTCDLTPQHTAAQQPSGSKPVIPSWSSSPTNSQIHRISASPSPQCQTLIGSADSFYEGTSRAPSSSALRHVELSTMAMSLSRKSAKSAKTTKTTKSGVPASVYPHAPHPSQQPVCTSPYHGIFNTCPCTPGALRLNSTPDSDTDTDDEDAVVVSPGTPPLWNYNKLSMLTYVQPLRFQRSLRCRIHHDTRTRHSLLWSGRWLR
jgi:hypothetical protein